MTIAIIKTALVIKESIILPNEESVGRPPIQVFPSQNRKIYTH